MYRSRHENCTIHVLDQGSTGPDPRSSTLAEETGCGALKGGNGNINLSDRVSASLLFNRRLLGEFPKCRETYE